MKSILYTFLILFFASCGTAKLAVSDDLKSSHDEYTVKGKDGILIRQKLSFGEFKTTKVKRSWTKGHSGRSGFGFGNPYQDDYVNIISTEYINKKQTVNFNLTDGALQSDVYCVSKFNSKDLQVGRRENSLFNIALDIFGDGYSSNSTYYVQIFTNKEDKPWQLLLDNEAAQVHSKKYIGYLTSEEGEHYTIHPATKMEINGKVGNTLAGAVGFEIRNAKEKTVAAVSLLDKGMVFMGKMSSEERFLLANVCAALLLQQHIDG
jgi:hypothetical protein